MHGVGDDREVPVSPGGLPLGEREMESGHDANLLRGISLAMDEAVDQDRVIVYASAA